MALPGTRFVLMKRKWRRYVVLRCDHRAGTALHKRPPFPSAQSTLRTFEQPDAEEYADRKV
jgi:hypothetical protein